MTALTSNHSSRSLRHFGRHYLEMVVAMLLGMVLLGVPATAALSVAGTSMSQLHHDLPALMLFGMAVTMTVPMVAWMRYRGHGWAASNEMAASMFIPSFAVIGLLAAGVVTDIGLLMTIQHVVMLPAMLVAMLLRLDEYAGGHTRAGAAQGAAAA
jgi:cytochrome bd-type quinol oxidase subunit 2